MAPSHLSPNAPTGYIPAQSHLRATALGSAGDPALGLEGCEASSSPPISPARTGPVAGTTRRLTRATHQYHTWVPHTWVVNEMRRISQLSMAEGGPPRRVTRETFDRYLDKARELAEDQAPTAVLREAEAERIVWRRLCKCSQLSFTNTF